MTLSPMVAKCAAYYEQEHGCRPDEFVLQIAEHIHKVSKMLTEMGQKDSKEGKKPYPADVFPRLVCEAFPQIPEGATAKVIADLWQSDYMDGYNAGGRCVEHAK